MSKTQQRKQGRQKQGSRTRPATGGVPPRRDADEETAFGQPRWALRAVLFSALAIVCAVVGVVYVLHANQRTVDQERNAKKVSIAGPAALARYEREPHVIFRNTALGDSYGKVVLVPRGDLAAPRAVRTSAVERVDFAGGRGVCLEADRGVITTYHGAVFDRHFKCCASSASPDLRVACRCRPTAVGPASPSSSPATPTPTSTSPPRRASSTCARASCSRSRAVHRPQPRRGRGLHRSELLGHHLQAGSRWQTGFRRQA